MIDTFKTSGLLKIAALIILVILILGTIIFFFSKNEEKASFHLDSTGISWVFDGKAWKASGKPPKCPNPLTFDSPVDVSLASGILYPGQIRGSDYKPHGGFRFDNRNTNDIEVHSVMDGYILKASKYEVGGEIQNLLFYVNTCGIMAMNDHLLTLSPKLKDVFDKLPVGENGDSRTTSIEPKVYIKKGELLATEIGFKKNKNIFLDFGLYDLRKTNSIDYNSDFKSKHPNINEYGTHAICWFDYLSAENERAVRSLPAGGHEGKISDYCK